MNKTGLLSGTIKFPYIGRFKGNANILADAQLQ